MRSLKSGVALAWLATGVVAHAAHKGLPTQPAQSAQAVHAAKPAQMRTLVLEDGQVVQFEAGEILVPESRERPTQRTIAIPYYRLRSTASQPAAPIFLLAGGPGDSWIDRFETRDGRDEALFYRQIGDVVLFDQRAAGHARPKLACPDSLGLPLDEAVTAQSYAVALRRAARECRAHWEREGVDLKAYNTLENAADVDQLRRSLGYGKISLVGGSYGSHLALALVRHYPDVIARAVLFGVEGPDHTYDLPSGALQGFEQIASAAEKSPVFQDRIPRGGLIEALRQVERRLDAHPAVVEVERDGKSVRVTVGRFDVQRAIPSGALNLDNLAWAARVLEIIEGDLARVARDAITTREQHLDAMYFMMDCASGISKQRLEHLRSDPAERAAQDVLGDPNGEYFAACAEWGSPELGAAFRSDVISATPALIFRGTWDFATPVQNAAEVARGFARGHLVTVEGGTHLTLKDLYKLWTPMRPLMSEFLNGRKVAPPAVVTLPDAAFKPPAERLRVDYQRAAALLEDNVARVTSGLRLIPEWIGKTDRFRYRMARPEGTELVSVDAARNTRESRPCNPDPGACETARLPAGVAATEVASPDGKWAAFVRDHDLHIRSLTGSQTIRLTNDGAENYAYGAWADSHLLSVTAARGGKVRPARVLWSPDSRKLLSYRVDQRRVPEMPFVQWVPQEGHGARPVVHTARVPLPADPHVAMASLVIFHLPDGRRVDVRDEPLQLSYDFISGGQVWWDAHGDSVLYVHEERGFRTVSLRLASATTGETRTLVQEITANSFKGGYDLWARQGTTASSVLWLSPRDGWQHLYRYDIRDGRLLSQVTRGEWAVKEVLHTDSREGWVYFTAGGREPGRDPYLLHLYRVRPDGTRTQLLTPEDAHHEISFSPGGRYFIDRYSRVDTPPVTVLRAADGRLVRVLERADIGALLARGWSKPERFRAKARDGETDIYGVLYRPSDLDPRRKYPVVEDIYGGPQQVHAPRAFTAGEPLAELGFIVVQIDGMGTPGRSQAFQDVSYGKGFAEAGGLEDHIAAIRQLATRYPYLDLDRVGIYGYSGGGYAAARAVFDYPEFYKVAVSGAGSHDQHLYQFEWGEHFIGRPADAAGAYALQANRTRVKNFRGKLLLAHGDLDDDVPLVNTMQLVDALVAANKDFDLLIAPNRNHDSLYTDPYFIRRQWDYFVRHLRGVEPPAPQSFGKGGGPSGR